MLTWRQNPAPGVSPLLFGMFWQHISPISAFGSFRTSRPSSAERVPLISLREVSNFSSKSFNRRERIALEDEYLISRKLYANVDFYSGIVYQAMGLPVAMFAIPRRVGWLAQWQEIVTDPEQKITRPRQIFVGHSRRELPTWQSARLECAGVKKTSHRLQRLVSSPLHGTNSPAWINCPCLWGTKYFACYPNSDRRRRRPKC